MAPAPMIGQMCICPPKIVHSPQASDQLAERRCSHSSVLGMNRIGCNGRGRAPDVAVGQHAQIVGRQVERLGDAGRR